MLSSTLLSLFPPPKPNTFGLNCHLPMSKYGILTRGLQSKRFLGGGVGRIRVSDKKKMTELVGFDAFWGSTGSENEAEVILRDGPLSENEAEVIFRDGSLSENEAEVILRDRPLIFSRDFDLSGFESTLNRMSKWLVTILFGIVVLWKHDAGALWAAMGSVGNSWLSVKLKQILNHERPASALRSDPGMPSSHAQSIFYTAFFAFLSLFHWQGVNAFTVGTGSMILICGAYLSWLRVSQKLHTMNQVTVGAILGSLCSITWFWMWHSFVLSAFSASIWVRAVIDLGSLAACVGFLFYVVQHWWLKDGNDRFICVRVRKKQCFDVLGRRIVVEKELQVKER